MEHTYVCGSIAILCTISPDEFNPRTHGQRLKSGAKNVFVCTTNYTLIRTGRGIIQWLLERENVALHATIIFFSESLTNFAEQWP